MKLRRLFAGVMVASLAFSSMAISSFAAKGAVVLDVTSEFQAYVDSDDGGSDNIENAGGGDRTFSADKGLLRFDRSNDYDSIDLKAANLADGKYIVEAVFAADEDCVFRVANGASPYGPITADSAATTSYTATLELEVISGQWQTTTQGDDPKESAQDRIRFQTDGDHATTNFYIKSLVVYANDEGGAATDTASTDGDAANTATSGDTTTATGADKQSTNTGVEGVAVIAGLAVLAAGAVIISRKRA